MAATQRREVVSFTLPANVINSLREKAQRNFRAVSREAEVAIVHHLADQESVAS